MAECSSTAKTNPPFNVVAISEKQFPESLLINWSQPIKNVYVKLIYQIRYCKHGSQTWSEVSLAVLSFITYLIVFYYWNFLKFILITRNFNNV
jgi:hypothetical protein